MAKKKKSDQESYGEKWLSAFNNLNPNGKPLTFADLESACNEVANTMTEMERAKYGALDFLITNGVTPEEFEMYYQTYQHADEIFQMMSNAPENGLNRGRTKVKEYAPLPGADDYAMVLKIQMKGVAKPPMWREVEVPADYDFYLLHDVIQAVCGFEDCHLWQFNKTAYDNSLEIGIEKDDDDDFGFGLEQVTHSADETPLTQFLQQPGDTLEYVYDFGDDWIFKIEVKELVKKQLQSPVCRKFKGELNPVEDSGGVWSYLSMRKDLEEWDSLTPKERKKRAEEQGFDSANEYIDLLRDYLFDINEVNSTLSQL